MNQIDLARDLIATYQKHGWKLREMLLRQKTLAEFGYRSEPMLEGVGMKEAPLDALWFSRPSHGKREAWELRLLAETQYALFEAFEADQPESSREAIRREMEARMIQSHGPGEGRASDVQSSKT